MVSSFKSCRECADELARRPCEYGTAVQLCHVGCGALAKADHHATFLAHELDPEPRAAAVAEHRSAQRREPALRRNAPDALKSAAQLALLGAELRGRLQVLQRAASADAKVRAVRAHPRSRRPPAPRSSCASSCWRRRRVRRKRMRSPGSAPATKTVLPPCTTPSPSCVRLVTRPVSSGGGRARRSPVPAAGTLKAPPPTPAGTRRGAARPPRADSPSPARSPRRALRARAPRAAAQSAAR